MLFKHLNSTLGFIYFARPEAVEICSLSPYHNPPHNVIVMSLSSELSKRKWEIAVTLWRLTESNLTPQECFPFLNHKYLRESKDSIGVWPIFATVERITFLPNPIGDLSSCPTKGEQMAQKVGEMCNAYYWYRVEY